MGSAKEVVNHILMMKEDEKLTVTSFLWVWWDVRNKTNAGEEMLDTGQVVHRTRCMATSWRDPSLNPSAAPSASHRENPQWSPPPPDVLKINSDGAFNPKEKAGAYGFIISETMTVMGC